MSPEGHLTDYHRYSAVVRNSDHKSEISISLLVILVFIILNTIRILFPLVLLDLKIF